MGYFDAIAAGSFKKDRSGNQIFFPWGVLGCGYQVPAEADYERLRKLLVRFYKLALPVVIALAVLAPVGWLLLALLLPIFVLLYAAWVRRATKHWVPSQERLSFQEILAIQAQSHSMGTLWLLFCGCLLLLVGGITILFLNPNEWFIGVSCIVFFVACALFIQRMLTVKRAAQSSARTKE